MATHKRRARGQGTVFVRKDGRVIASYGSRTRPDDADLRAAIDAALAAPAAAE